MVATIRAWSASAPGGSETIALPAGTQNGDLLVLCVQQSTEPVNLPTSGGGTWTSRYTGSGSGTYTDQVRLSTKVKAAGDTTVTLGLQSGYGPYGCAVMVALYDLDTTTFFTAVAQTAAVSPITAPAGTPAQAGKRLSFASQISNSSAAPAFTTPSGTTLGQTITAGGGYHRMAGYVDTADAVASVAVVARSIVTDSPGGNVGVTFVAYNTVAAPTVSGPKVKAGGAFGAVKAHKVRAAGVFTAKPHKVKVAGSFVTAD